MGSFVPIILVILWEILSRTGFFPPNWLPAPSIIVITIFDLAKNGELVGHIGITLYRIVLGFAVGALIGTLAGALTGYSKTLRRLFDPFIQSMRNIPSMAWVPLFLLWLGIQEASKITLIAVGVFFPVYLNLANGIIHIDQKLIEVGKVFRLNSFQLIKRVILPAAMPYYIVALRSGLGLGWMFVVAAEIMGASKGIGFLMTDGQMTGRPAIIIASIIMFAILGKCTDLIIEIIGNHLLRYKEAGN